MMVFRANVATEDDRDENEDDDEDDDDDGGDEDGDNDDDEDDDRDEDRQVAQRRRVLSDARSRQRLARQAEWPKVLQPSPQQSEAMLQCAELGCLRYCGSKHHRRSDAVCLRQQVSGYDFNTKVM